MTATGVRRRHAAWVVVSLLGPAISLAQPEDKSNSPPNVIDGAELVQALRAGGHVLYFRHGKTDLSTRDADRASLDNCTTQRVLSDEGRQQMTQIGREFKRLRIPVGTVLASPYCRTLDTARLAFGRVSPEPELSHTVTADAATTQRRAAVLSKLLAVEPHPAPTPCCRATPATCRRPPGSGPVPKAWRSSSSPMVAAQASIWRRSIRRAGSSSAAKRRRLEQPSAERRSAP
jgi:hypothetical protein